MPDTGLLIATGQAPEVLITNDVTVEPGTGEAIYTGRAPQIAGDLIYGPVFLSSPIHTVFNCVSHIEIASLKSSVNKIVSLKSPIT